MRLFMNLASGVIPSDCMLQNYISPANNGVNVKVRPNASLRAGESAIVIPLEDAAIIVLADDDNDDEDGPRSPIPLLVDIKAWRIAPKKLRLALLLIHDRNKGISSRFSRLN
jgi:hypothetical protein